MVRTVRLRAGLTQVQVAERARTSSATISRLEAGLVGPMPVALLRRVSDALGMPSLVSLGWRGADVAHLLDEGHAALVERVVEALRRRAWEPIVEYSFSHYGERGSVDVVAWHPATQSLLVVEVKTRIVDLQDLASGMDRKRRLVPKLLLAERDWRPAQVGLVLVVCATSTTRGMVDRHAAIFETMLPARTVAVRRWLAAPAGELRGIWFLQDSHRT